MVERLDGLTWTWQERPARWKNSRHYRAFQYYSSAVQLKQSYLPGCHLSTFIWTAFSMKPAKIDGGGGDDVVRDTLKLKQKYMENSDPCRRRAEKAFRDRALVSGVETEELSCFQIVIHPSEVGRCYLASERSRKSLVEKRGIFAVIRASGIVTSSSGPVGIKVKESYHPVGPIQPPGNGHVRTDH